MTRSPLWLRDVLAPMLEGDELIEITSYGSEPEYITGRRAAEIATAKARTLYVEGIITADDFQLAVDEIAKADKQLAA